MGMWIGVLDLRRDGAVLLAADRSGTFNGNAVCSIQTGS
jgi:hypothetical protein